MGSAYQAASSAREARSTYSTGPMARVTIGWLSAPISRPCWRATSMRLRNSARSMASGGSDRPEAMQSLAGGGPGVGPRGRIGQPEVAAQVVQAGAEERIVVQERAPALAHGGHLAQEALALLPGQVQAARGGLVV